MGDVTLLHGAQMPSSVGEPRQTLIDVLADLLERAKSGELQSFVGSGFTKDGHRFAVWHDSHENVYEMLGSIVWLEHEYVARRVSMMPDGQHP